MSAEHLSTDQIAKLARQLKQKHTDLESQLEHSRQGSEPVTLDQQSVGRISRMDAIQQQQMNVANREQAALLLKAITSALKRIDSHELCVSIASLHKSKINSVARWSNRNYSDCTRKWPASWLR